MVLDAAALLPAGIGPGVAVLLVVASFFTSALTATFGVGGGIAMLMLLGLYVPVAALIPVHGAIQLGSNTGRTWHQRRHVRWSVASPFLAGSLVGAIGETVISEKHAGTGMVWVGMKLPQSIVLNGSFMSC